jgi:ElaA protein|tara:strand:- start:6586 stop:7020 length:435 start_codon:yes stop_codon:yes gene_type:complete
VRTIRDCKFSELDTSTLYSIMRLRAVVFVVEQDIVYTDPDDRDSEDGTRHVFVDGAGGVVSYLRVLAEDDGKHRIGRVVTDQAHRSQGLARRLIDHVHGSTPGRITLHAQAHLEDWYRSLGYERTGPDFDDEGLPHVPMERTAI